MRDVSERLEGPAMSLRIERGIVRVIEKLRDGGLPLLGREHSRLRHTARRPFTNDRCRIVVHGLQQ